MRVARSSAPEKSWVRYRYEAFRPSVSASSGAIAERGVDRGARLVVAPEVSGEARPLEIQAAEEAQSGRVRRPVHVDLERVDQTCELVFARRRTTGVDRSRRRPRRGTGSACVGPVAETDVAEPDDQRGDHGEHSESNLHDPSRTNERRRSAATGVAADRPTGVDYGCGVPRYGKLVV